MVKLKIIFFGELIMSYIGDMRKFVGHAPIMSVAAMGILYKKKKKGRRKKKR